MGLYLRDLLKPSTPLVEKAMKAKNYSNTRSRTVAKLHVLIGSILVVLPASVAALLILLFKQTDRNFAIVLVIAACCIALMTGVYLVMKLRGELESKLEELESAQEKLIHQESALRENEASLRTIVEGAQDHVIISFDDTGKILKWSGAAKRLLGYLPEEITELRYQNLFSDEDRAAGNDRQLLSQALSKGRAEFDGWRIGKEGRKFWADITVSRLEKLPGSQTGGYVEIARDITPRKAAEEALVLARNNAEASNRAKTEFMGNMSHEIRTPMNGIIGMTSLLLDEPLTDEQQDLAETIKTSGESLLTIIEDILDISRIEAGQLEITLRPVNLIELVELTMESFGLSCHEKGLSLGVYVDKAVPSLIETDPSRLRQILSNLIGNAIKFTNSGGITIEVLYDPPTEEVLIQVKDTGIGISESNFAKLFTPFFQAESTHSRRYSGTGLGLSISQKIANLLNSDITVQSALSQGSTFTLTMKGHQKSGEDFFPNFDGKQILIVADETSASHVLQKQIETWNAHVDLRSPNFELIDYAKFDLIILDSTTSELGIYDKFLSDSTDTTPPILVFLPHHKKPQPFHGQNIRFIHKPIHPSELNTILRGTFHIPSENPGQSSGSINSPKKLDPEFASKFPHKILIVEDDSINAKVLETIFKKLGYQADVAENGEACLKALASKAYDIIFMDLQMPVMDGYKATLKILNSDSIQHKIFITAFTAKANQNDRDACKAVGMHDFVAKPARPQKIVDVLNRAHTWLETSTVTTDH